MSGKPLSEMTSAELAAERSRLADLQIKNLDGFIRFLSIYLWVLAGFGVVVLAVPFALFFFGGVR